MTTTENSPQAVASALAWPPRMTGSEWADANRVLPSADAEPGPYRTDRFPLIREIQDALCDDTTRRVVLWGPTQAGKTTAISNFLGWCIEHKPGRTLIVYPTEDKATEFSTEKLEPMLLACPSLKAKAEIGTARTHRKSVLSKTFPGMTLLMRGGNSTNPFSSGSIPYVILDELDRIPATKEGNPIDLAVQRTTTYLQHKVVLASTCTDAGASPIEAEYLKSDQRKPYVPCAACVHMHVMGFFPPGTAGYEPGTGWVDFDGLKDANEAAAAARYVCPECRHEHHGRDKAAMLAGVEWRKGNPASETAGFWWSALYSPWVTFGQLAYEWRASSGDEDSRKVFWNCRLSRTWAVKGERPGEDVLSSCIDADRACGQVPEGSVLLTAGVDVQKREVYYAVRAWGEDGQSWLVDNGKVFREAYDFGDLEDVLSATYDGHPIAQTFIDSGYDTPEVYAFCAQWPNASVLPCKGEKPRDERYIWPSEAKPMKETGHPLPRGLTLYLVNSNKIRGVIHSSMAIEEGARGAWRLHCDVGSEYCSHLLNRQRVKVFRRGFEVEEWDDSQKPDHYLDAEIYAFAASRRRRLDAQLGRRGSRAAVRSWADRKRDKRTSHSWR